MPQNIIPRRFLRRSEWFLAEYPCQGGCSEGRRQLALLWLHGLSHLKSIYFVPYLIYVLQNKVFK